MKNGFCLYFFLQLLFAFQVFAQDIEQTDPYFYLDNADYYFAEGDFEKAKTNALSAYKIGLSQNRAFVKIMAIQVWSEAMRVTNLNELDELMFLADTLQKEINIGLELLKTPKYQQNEGAKESIGICYLTLGNIYLNCSELDEKFINPAVTAYQNQIKFSIENTSKANGYFNISYLYIINKNVRLAWENFLIGERTKPSNYPAENNLRNYNNIGFMFSQNGEFEKALQYFQKGLKIIDNKLEGDENPSLGLLEEFQNKEYLITLLRDKADFFLKTFKIKNDSVLIKQALVSYKLADELIDIMRLQQAKGTKLFWRGEAHDFYENAIEACLILKDNSAAYQFMEKSKAVVLFEEINSKNDNLRNADILVLPDLVTKLNATQQNFVSYFVGKEAVYVFCIKSNKEIKFDKIALKPTELETLLEQFLDYSSKKRTWIQSIKNYLFFWQSPDYEPAYQLFHKLVEPLNLTAQSDLIIAFDGVFPSFDAFLTKNKEEKDAFLINHYNIIYAYSASLFFREYLNESFQDYENQFLSVSPEVFQYDSFLKPLAAFANRKEISYSGTILSKEQADSATVFEHLKFHQIALFFTHGGVANGGFIALHDKKVFLSQSFETKAQLVLLTACQTARGKNAKGEGIMSIARSFAVEGVPSTIASLWDIPSSSSASIVNEFLINLSHNKSCGIALKMAKLEVLENDLSPNSWAGLVLIGKNIKIPVVSKEMAALSLRK